MILTIDGGTTHTRLYLMDNGSILTTRKLSAGIRDTYTPEGRAAYTAAIRRAIAEITAREQPEAVLCSGMIGSETGLANIPHIGTPVSFRRLADGMQAVSLPEIADLPFYFIPGVKTFSRTDYTAAGIPTEELADMDIMRGEETELAGIAAKMGLSGGVTLILPGSHMKFVTLDKEGQITAFRTALTGELLRAAAEHTILAASLADGFPAQPDACQLCRGYALSASLGLTQALFKVRILDRSIGGLTPAELYSFLMGIVLQEECGRLCREKTPVCIAGSDPFRTAYRILLEKGGLTVTEIPEEISGNAAAYGAYRLWTERK
ncbi:MAG: 2-dehydro-3-deoxygalactonokinase [Clostridia bacterium]|nr:2-dehydro-3-deoxygalactonokinase [Clostridia bacterium]